MGAIEMDMKNTMTVELPSAPHTVKRFDEELELLRTSILQMAEADQAQLERLADAFASMDAEAASEIAANDAVINAWELGIDKTLEIVFARRSPHALDLRLLLGCSRMTTDLERLGDEIRNAAEGTARIARSAQRLPASQEKALEALFRDVLDACREAVEVIRTLDGVRARALMKRRAAVSRSAKKALIDVIRAMECSPAVLLAGLEAIRINRALERAAAHMENIGEGAVFIAEGNDLRHAGDAEEAGNEDAEKP